MSTPQEFLHLQEAPVLWEQCTGHRCGTSTRRYLIDVVPLLDADLLGASARLCSHQLLQVSNGIVLAAGGNM